MSSKDPIKITLPDDEDGEPQGWLLLRGKGDKFKAGERQALYRYVDEIKGSDAGDIMQNMLLVRRMVCHILRDWSLDLPRPTAHVLNGQVTGYENTEVLDQLDTAFEDELLLYAGQWLRQIAVNFQPTPAPDSPTAPSVA